MILNRREKSIQTVSDVKQRLAILSMVLCVLVSGAAVSGCGVQMGQEKIQNAREVKKQVEDSQRKLEKNLGKKLEQGQ
ncbi:MAG TPA: hypothetical protein VJ827_08480 [Rubrobacter sp.]|nr:hypothetical protein [Rubrobacter sp.]